MINIKKIKPLFTALVTTMDRYTQPEYVPGTSLIDPTKQKFGIKEYQKVLAVGESVRGIGVGDVVCINPSRYAKKKYASGSIKNDVEEMNPVISYEFNIISLDGVECLLLDNRDIDFVIEEYEEIEDAPPVIEVEKSKLILPN